MVEAAKKKSYTITLGLLWVIVAIVVLLGVGILIGKVCNKPTIKTDAAVVEVKPEVKAVVPEKKADVKKADVKKDVKKEEPKKK